VPGRCAESIRSSPRRQSTSARLVRCRGVTQPGLHPEAPFVSRLTHRPGPRAATTKPRPVPAVSV